MIMETVNVVFDDSSSQKVIIKMFDLSKDKPYESGLADASESI